MRACIAIMIELCDLRKEPRKRAGTNRALYFSETQKTAAYLFKKI